MNKRKLIIVVMVGSFAGVIGYCLGKNRKKRVADSNNDNVVKDNGRKLHILLISQYFYPETFRVNDMAVEWVKRGYKVTVLTGIPNYPMGKYFDGYDLKHRRREQWKGVNIIRVPLIARGNNQNKIVNAIGMSMNYLSFVVSGFKWVRSKQARELNTDLIFTVEVSPMTQALIGCWYGKRYDVPVYLYVQDLWPENVETVTGIHCRAIIAPIERMVKYIYNYTDHIFTISPSFVKEIVKRGVDESKVHYWPQYAEEFYRPSDRAEAENNLLKSGNHKLVVLAKKIKFNDAFYIAFTGNIGTAQGLDILPRVAEKLKKYESLGTGNTKPVHFIIVGDGRYQKTLEDEIANRNVTDMFTFVPRQRPEIIPNILALADAAFLSFSNNPLWSMTIPAKLQSYMACGKDIIASASGETERVINEAECGICTEIGDSEALTDGIKRLINFDNKGMGEKARAYFEAKFDKKKLMDEMDSFFCESNF